MFRDINNMRRMVELVGDEGFVRALTNVEQVIGEANQTMERVEQIEGEAKHAVKEANEALEDVDQRLQKVDETVHLLEAKIEAGFTLAFFFFALNQYLEGQLLLAAGLFGMGLLGVSSLFVTIVRMPQMRRLLKLLRYAIRGVDKRTEVDLGTDKK